ncbi:hypothetical protein [Cetobacterium sp.]|uniref:hypothetical protein n=1 Tax=Cetobacterium sp. TaxID=2071632 RepID=UPI003F40BE35
MFFNKNSLHILNLFLSNERYNIKQLEEILKIKKRSILANVSVINDFLRIHKIKGIIEKENYFYIEEKESTKIKGFLSEAPLGALERREYMLLKIFFSEKVILSKDFLEIDVTRRTINNDLQSLRNQILEYDLKILSTSIEGVFLEGKERNIRVSFVKYLTRYFIQKNKYHNLFEKLINSRLKKEELKKAQDIILNLSKKMDVKLPIEYFYKLVALILVSCYREDKRCDFYEEDKNSKYILKNTNCGIFINFFKINEVSNLKQYEIDTIIDVFLCFDKKNFLKKSDYRIDVFFKRLEEKLNIDIQTKSIISIKVLKIIEISRLKKELGLSTDEKIGILWDKYKEYYFEISSIIKEVIPEIYDEDILYLTIFIKDNLDSIILKDKKNKRILIIDDSFEKMYGKIVLSYLKKNYYIDILKIINSYECDESLIERYELDFILSLSEIEIRELKIPVLNIKVENILKNSYRLESYGVLKK